MKTFTKIIIGVAGAALLLGLGLFICGTTLGYRNGFGLSELDDAPKKVISEMGIDAFDSMEICNTYGEVKIERADEFGIEIITRLPEDEVEYSNENGKLVAKVVSSNNYHVLDMRRTVISLAQLFVKDQSEGIIVYIPEGVEFKDVSVDASLGKIAIDGLSSANLNIIADLGSVYLTDVEADESIISMDNGSLSAKNCEFGNVDYINDLGSSKISKSNFNAFKFDATNGSVDITDCTVKTLIGNNDLGSIRIFDSVLGKVELEATNGSVEIVGVFDSAYIRNDLGSVKLTTSKQIDDYRIEASTDLGSIKINGDKQGDSIRQGNIENPVIDIEGTNGSVDLNFDN